MRGQFSLDMSPAIFVDNFAGGGGASTGFYMATGRHIDHAINHDAIALGMHCINHPQTVHHCEDVYDVHPEQFGRPIGGAWFSPDCKHHSKAKGGKPRDKKIRSLAFVMLRYAKFAAKQLLESGQPMTMYMENVEEIAKWGPLLSNGKPDRSQEGRTWQGLLAALGDGIDPDHPDIPEMIEALGGTVSREELIIGFGFRGESQERRAFVDGTPTIRKRLYLVLRNDGKPVVWPEETHAAPPDAKANGLKKWRTIAECLDFSIPCPSIFLTQVEARKFRCRRPLKRNTLRRVARGTDRYILKAKKPFIIPLTHQGGDRVESIDRPANTVTGAHRGEKGLVAASFVTEHANASNQRNMPVDEPARTQCAEVKGGHFALSSAALVHTAHGEQDKNGKKRGRGEKAITEPLPSVLGSQDCALFAAHLTKFNGGSTGCELTDPCPTVPAGSHSPDTRGGAATPLGIVTAHLARDFGQSIGQSVDKPAPTVMPEGQGKTKLISTTVVNVANSKTTGRGPNTWPVDEPARTITQTPGFAAMSATVVGAGGPEFSGKPRPIDKPAGTLMTENHSTVAAVSLCRFNSEKSEQDAPRGQEVESPASTLDTSNRLGVTAASMVKLRGDNIGYGMDEPGQTVSAQGQHHAVKMCTAVKYYGNEKEGQDINGPAHTVTTKDRFGLAESEGASYPLTPEQLAGARRVAAFLREYGVEFEGEFATVQGYVIVDIGLRMLTPRELYRAQGFPEDYIIDRAWVVDPETGKTIETFLTKEQQIRMCGNSVCPQVAAALIRANNPEMIVRHFTEADTRYMERMAA